MEADFTGHADHLVQEILAGPLLSDKQYELLSQLLDVFSDYMTSNDEKKRRQDRRIKELESQLNRVPLGRLKD